jgi:hypothetical protein
MRQANTRLVKRERPAEPASRAGMLDGLAMPLRRAERVKEAMLVGIAVLVLISLVVATISGPAEGALMPTRIDDAGGNFVPIFEMSKVLKYGFGAQWDYQRDGYLSNHIIASALYSTGTKRWYPSLFVEQALLPKDRLHAFARASRLAEPFAFDDHILTRDENTIAAFAIREDFFDYTEVRRVAGGLRLGPIAEQTLTVEIVKERHKVMDRVTQKAGLFGGDKVFPRNAFSTEMEPTLIRARYDWFSPGGVSPWDTERWWSRRNGAWLTWTGWWADPSIAGNLDLSRQLVEGRLRLSPSRRIELRFRAAVGFTPYGSLYGRGFATYPGLEGIEIMPPDEPSYLSGPARLPPQWTFHAGGIGTLRGHDEKEFVGDHVVLANLEYVVRTSRDFGIVLFTDLGRAWYDDLEGDVVVNDLDDLAWDGGIGLEFNDRDLRVQIGQDLRDFERNPRFTLRLERAF